MSFDELNEQLKELASFRTEQRTANAVEALRKAQAEHSRLPMCPYCGGRIQVGYELCQYCRNPLAWVQGHPCKPGQQESLRVQLEKDAKDRAIAERKSTFGCLQTTAILTGTVSFICALFFVAVSSSEAIDHNAIMPIAIVGFTSAAITIMCAGNALSVRDEIRLQTPEYRTAMENKKQIENEKIWAKNRAVREEKEAKIETEKLFARAEMHLDRGNVPMACECLSKLVLLYPDSPLAARAKKIYESEKDAHENQKEAEELYRKKEYEKAIAILVLIEKNYPETQGGIRAKNILDIESQASELYSKVLKLKKPYNKASSLKLLHEIVSRFPKTQFGIAAKQYLDNQSRARNPAKPMHKNEKEEASLQPLVKCKHCKAVFRMVERKPNQILRCPKCKNTVYSE